MDWISDFNHAIDYIEAHLTEKLDYDQIAEAAGCPAYYFQKMFTYMTRLSLTEYIRRRRMSLAAVELQGSHVKIIDIALKYGYDSPTAFNRAFQSVHGSAPSVIKSGRGTLKSYPPLQFTLHVRGAEPLAFKIEEKAAFCVIGKSVLLHKNMEENFKTIPAAWDNALADGTLTALSAIMNGQPSGLLGVSSHHTEDWKYYIGVSSDKDAGAFETLQIPAAVWAVFEGKGTNKSLQELERRVITEWLPASGYRYADIPDIEVYIQADPQHTVYEYWLPVIKNQEE